MVVPVPEQAGQVLAIWNPLSITKVRVPDPPQVVHADRLAPFFNPVLEHVPQSTTGVMLIFRTAPLQASKKVTPTLASMSSPLVLCENPPPAPRPRPENAPPNS